MQFCTSSGCITCLVSGTVHDSIICTSVVHHAVPPWGERKTSPEPCAMHNGGGKEFVEKKQAVKKNLRVHKSNIGKVKMPNYWKRVVFLLSIWFWELANHKICQIDFSKLLEML